ncbi:CDP-alcohol phosphatidyltransferase family protein [Mumia sp. zg.B53]|uniref:CDP-alcohol phosphatidyltransferase family protein n=1 Tax=unclassified Mumia TaxID=2621872 RepID=UPI001C6EB43C|nr:MULTISPECIES: CDP-alcohol phosphatidyltransferase family protein [unclassified Mumia]MBW9206910.1 CDP-alcohol phosphatidyltransferase family protein [Mumia sp. zg.B17]MBW9215368.1 CDP-alcohol phosphatidyltransferase family protein [Mumia sp. zg.B53]MDD9348380.1 CDP-alcohol phosphatidyltransferase family protein [Mumia sp.]
MTTATRTVKEALDALRRAQKPAKGTAAYSRHVNRPLGRQVAAVVSTVGMTPNQATAISASLSTAAIALLALTEPTVVTACAIAVLLALGYVMDSVDGQLARLAGAGSRSGEWLDHMIDCIKTSTLHLAVLISWFRWPTYDEAGWLLVPVAYEVVAVVTFFGLILVPTLRPAGSRGSTIDVDREEHPARRWLLLPTDYGVLCLVFVLLAWGPAFTAVYTALMLANAAALAAALVKWWRELRALDRASGGPR